MTDVGDAVELTFTTVTGAAVTAETRTYPGGATTGPVPVPEDAATGNYPYTFLPAAGMTRVTFRATGTVTATEKHWIYASPIDGPIPLATVEDITPWRALTTEEALLASLLIDEASAQVRRRIPAVDDRLADGSLPRVLVVGAISRAVRRVLDSPPAGVSSWTVDDYTERYAADRATLYIAAEDWAELAPAGASGGAFTIRPAGRNRPSGTSRYVPW